MQLKAGTYLQNGKYRVISTLGQGGFGITYLAEQVMAKRNVCIKEFFPKEYYNRDNDSMHISLGSEGNAEMMNAYKAKFIKEAQTIANLNHPNIIRIFDVFEENNTAYYAMEYIDGESLNAKVKREGALAEDRAVKYIRDVASALDYIHKRNIMHLDVKPANVMLRKEDDSAILIDFGLSKQYDAAGDQTSSTPVGISHGYAPIEQYQSGGVSTFSPVTDIYSLGATLLFAVTGRVPAEAATIGEEGVGEIPDHTSANVRNAITHSMGYWRKDRPKSIDIFLAILDQAPAVKEVSEVIEVDDTTKIEEADTIIAEPVTPELTPVTPKSDYDDIYIKYKESGEKSEKTKKRKSRWWIWLLILIIGGAGFYVLYERDTPHNNTEIWYTSVDGNIVEPHNSSAFDANIVSNTYTNGKGVIKFDGNVTEIGAHAFYYCTSLTSVNIPDSVTAIGNSAFDECRSLTSVNIPDSVTEIGESAFNCCTSLTSVNIPDSVTTIGNEAFDTCTSLTSVNIPDSVTAIGNSAFAECRSLTSVNIPDSVTEIGAHAFLCCSLTSVNIPDSVTEIGGGAFGGCHSLTEFKGKFATEDGRSLIVDNTIIACANASGTTYTIPDSVTSIGEAAFWGCDSLTSVNIPDSVTTIGEYAFQYCTSLTSVTIPDSVTTIGDLAFYCCTSLTSVNIPDSVTTIGNEAFDTCTSLTSIYCKATTPPELHGSEVFYNYGCKERYIKIYVPRQSVNVYKNTKGWKEYADVIVGYDF